MMDNYSTPSHNRKGHHTADSCNLIGMIRARKFAIKLKKRAQFLVAHKRMRETTGRAILVHHDVPRIISREERFDSMYLGSRATERMQTTFSSSEKSGQAVREHKTIPDGVFPVSLIEQRIQDILERRLDGMKYNPDASKELSKDLAEEIKQDVKAHQDLTRYKLICVVNIGETKHQSDLRFGSRCLWNAKFDNFASSFYKNSQVFAVATVYGVYFE